MISLSPVLAVFRSFPCHLRKKQISAYFLTCSRFRDCAICDGDILIFCRKVLPPPTEDTRDRRCPGSGTYNDLSRGINPLNNNNNNNSPRHRSSRRASSTRSGRLWTRSPRLRDPYPPPPLLRSNRNRIQTARIPSYPPGSTPSNTTTTTTATRKRAASPGWRPPPPSIRTGPRPGLNPLPRARGARGGSKTTTTAAAPSSPPSTLRAAAALSRTDTYTAPSADIRRDNSPTSSAARSAPARRHRPTAAAVNSTPCPRPPGC